MLTIQLQVVRLSFMYSLLIANNLFLIEQREEKKKWMER
jgi:hypothetical protein